MAHPIPVAIAVLTRDHETFLVQRTRGRPLAGRWEFPGGKIEFGESPLEALRRELQEELGLALVSATLFGVYSHIYRIRGKRVHYVLLAFRGAIPSESVRERPGARWFGPKVLRDLPVVAGSRPIVADLVRSWQIT